MSCKTYTGARVLLTLGGIPIDPWNTGLAHLSGDPRKRQPGRILRFVGYNRANAASGDPSEKQGEFRTREYVRVVNHAGYRDRCD